MTYLAIKKKLLDKSFIRLYNCKRSYKRSKKRSPVIPLRCDHKRPGWQIVNEQSSAAPTGCAGIRRIVAVGNYGDGFQHQGNCGIQASPPRDSRGAIPWERVLPTISESC